MTEQRPEYLADALAMAGIDLDAPRQIIQEVSGFTPVFDAVVREHGLVTAAVHGVAWRFCQLDDGICRAKLETIGTILNLDESTVSRHLDTLCRNEYLVDTTPGLRNRPHIYADTGKVVMKSKLSAHLAQSKARPAQSKATTAENPMKIVNKIELEEKASTTPSTWPADWKVANGETIESVEEQFSVTCRDRANLIDMQCAGAGELSYAFMMARGMVIPETKIKGNRKAAREMLEMKVKPEHVTEAVKNLMAKNMTVTDLFSVSKTAIDLANKPQDKRDWEKDYL